MLEPLLIRADAGERMGAGHVMRCLALAQAWRDAGGRVEFLSFPLPPRLQAKLSSECIELTALALPPDSDSDMNATVSRARQIGARWVVMDGYQFGAVCQRRLKDAGLMVLFIDDYGHGGPYCADLVLNQNVNASEHVYLDRENRTRLLLGSRYVLLRREFLVWTRFQHSTPQIALKLLVTLGGADPDNITAKVLEAAARLPRPGLKVRAVLGPAYEPAGRQFNVSGLDIQFVTDATNMPELMAWADVAVSGAGSTCWELLFMQVPAAVLILAENQRLVAEELGRRGLAIKLGWGTEVSREQITSSLEELLNASEKRKQMSQLGRAFVDGEGPTRLVRLMCELAGSAVTSIPAETPA